MWRWRVWRQPSRRASSSSSASPASRPSIALFIGCAESKSSAINEPLYEAFCEALRALGVSVATGVFGERMAVELVNDGPVTIVL
jgi:D-Tyr-tRNAtyr deacylase